MTLLSIGHVSSIAQLRLVKTVPAPTEFAVAFVFGAGDFYTWVDNSSATDDGAIAVKPADRTGSGRWVVAAGAASDALDRIALWGSGTDGDVPVTGTVNLARDMHYNVLGPFTGSAALNPNDAVIRCQTLDMRGAVIGAISSPIVNGNAGAANGTGGAAPSGANVPTVGRTLGGAFRSIVGGAGGTGAGTAAGAATAQPGVTRVASGGTTGGTGSGGAGGAGATGDQTVFMNRLDKLVTEPLLSFVTDASAQREGIVMGGRAGGSGGGGGGDGTAGGGGGSGGNAGLPIFIYARRILTDALTSAACIRSNGGNGGNGGTPAAGNRGGGGAGAGGGGGPIYIAYEEMIGPEVPGAITAAGGTGGTGGSGTGTGTGANGAAGGPGGEIYLINVTTGVVGGTYAAAVTTSTAGSAGTAASGTTGGAGGAGGTATANLGVAA